MERKNRFFFTVTKKLDAFALKKNTPKFFCVLFSTIFAVFLSIRLLCTNF